MRRDGYDLNEKWQYHGSDPQKVRDELKGMGSDKDIKILAEALSIVMSVNFYGTKPVQKGDVAGKKKQKYDQAALELLAKMPERLKRLEASMRAKVTLNSLVASVPELSLVSASLMDNPVLPGLLQLGIKLASSVFPSLDHQVLACGHVVGSHQTAYRAELTALVYALQQIARGQVAARVWSDCLAVVRKARRIFHGARVRPNSSHADLWTIVYDLVQADALPNVRILKVVSHCDYCKANSAVEEWAFWHNQLVDNLASECNMRRPQIFWDDWTAAKESIAFHKEVHHSILQVIVSVGRHGASLLKGAQNNVVRPQPCESADQLCRLNVLQKSAKSSWIITAKLSRKYGHDNAFMLLLFDGGGFSKESRLLQPGPVWGGFLVCNFTLILFLQQVFGVDYIERWCLV